MNQHFKSAMGKVKADPELLAHTEQYLRTAMDTKPGATAFPLQKRSERPMKKALAASVAAVLLIGSFVTGYAYLKTPVAYVSLDINPSVELGVNALDRVVSVEGVNEDGQAILTGLDLIHTNVSSAMEQLVNAAAEQNFIKDDGTSVVAITAEAKNSGRAEQLATESQQAAQNAISQSNVSALLYKDCSDLSLRTEAKDLGISPGRYKLIKSLQALDPSLTVEELQNKKVSEIMVQLNDLLDSDDDDTDESAISDELKTVAKEAAMAAFEASKAEAGAAFEAAKAQASEIQKAAKEQAQALRQQADALLANQDAMSDEERAAAMAQAQALREQAEELVETANDQAEDIREAAGEEKEDAMEVAGEVKEKAMEAASGDQKDNKKSDADEETEETEEEDDAEDAKEASAAPSGSDQGKDNSAKGNSQSSNAPDKSQGKEQNKA